MITDYFMITEKSNQLQVIMITEYNYHKSGTNKNSDEQILKSRLLLL